MRRTHRPIMESRNSVRMVLLGKTGTGKSASGNTILGRDAFLSGNNLNPVTPSSSIEETQLGGRTVSVVDTPGFYDTTLSEAALAEELGRSVYLSRPGLHAFLYVMPVNQRFTQQEFEVAQQLFKVFGNEVSKYTIVLFTHGDDRPQNLSDQISKNKYLSSFIQQCGGRYHVFNNKERNREQVTGLLEMIDRVVTQNEGSYYTSELFTRANRSTWANFWDGLKKFFQFAIAAMRAVYLMAQTLNDAAMHVKKFLECDEVIQFSQAWLAIYGS
ncbi:hypothetical protein MHYP_G00345610 [Metynnis hypsauchen]